MANMEQMMHVANSCPGYNATRAGIVSGIGKENGKSCANCDHWENNRCNINLFDEVLTSLDQT